MTRSPADVDHLSASSMRLYLNCPRQWAAQYLDEMPRRIGSALVKGKAVDHAASVNWEQKADTGEDLPVEAACELAENAFYNDVDQAGGRDSVDWGRGSNFGAELDSTIRLTKRFMHDIAPPITPVAVQQRFVKRLPDGRDFLGFIDAVLTEDMSELLDVKTSTRRMPQGDADKDLQASAYIWATGQPGRLHFARVMHSRGGAVSSELVTTSRTAAQIAAFEELATQVSTLINGGVYPRIAGWWCGFCPIQNTCPIGGMA